jgi:hypothetical protein
MIPEQKCVFHPNNMMLIVFIVLIIELYFLEWLVAEFRKLAGENYHLKYGYFYE